MATKVTSAAVAASTTTTTTIAATTAVTTAATTTSATVPSTPPPTISVTKTLSDDVIEAVESVHIDKSKFVVPESLRRPILTRPMVLMGTGPTNPTPRVLEALNRPVMGIYTEEVAKIMDEVRDGVKYLFQTTNDYTFCSSGSGNSGLDTVLGNLIEEGDVVVAGIIGSFSLRGVDTAKRYGADVKVVETKLGTALSYERIRAHVETHKPKILYLVHGDSSTGVLQSLENVGDLCRRNNCLFVVDAVSTLGSVDFRVDEWKIDAAFAASQKVLGGAPGLAPVTFGPRAIAAIKKRKQPPPTYYYDALLLGNFWKCTDSPRLYHHTISVPVLYAMRETLAEIFEQGLDVFKQRHVDNALRLQEGLQNIGLELFVENPKERLVAVTTVRIPHGVKFENVRKYLMERYSLEISRGFGITLDILFRIGLMNANATHQKVDFVLRALYDALSVTSNYIAPQSKIYY